MSCIICYRDNEDVLLCDRCTARCLLLSDEQVEELIIRCRERRGKEAANILTKLFDREISDGRKPEVREPLVKVHLHVSRADSPKVSQKIIVKPGTEKRPEPV